MEELNRQMEEALGELARGVFGGLLGGSLRHMFEELRRAGVPGVPGAQVGGGGAVGVCGADVELTAATSVTRGRGAACSEGYKAPQARLSQGVGWH